MVDWAVSTSLIIQRFFSVIIDWGCYFEASKNVSNVICVLFEYLVSSNLIFKCHKTKFQTCLSLNIWNHSNVDTFVQVSSLLTWDTLTHVSTVSTSENDYQANTVGKKIVLVASHRINHNDGSGTLVKWRAEGKYVGKGDYQNLQLSFYL